MDNVFYKSFFTMNSRCDIIIPHVKEDIASVVFSDIEKEIKRIESKVNIFDFHSELSLINQFAKEQDVAVDEEMFFILSECIELNKKTFGNFDVSIGNFLKDNEATDKERIIQLDSKNCKVRFSGEFSINLGGYAKGYALEKAKEILEKSETSSAIVSLGNSSIYCKGLHPVGKPWKIGIPHVKNHREVVSEIELSDSSCGTSGFHLSKGKPIFHHICPASGQRVEKMETISVIHTSPITSEILSTALFVAQPTEISSILSNFTESKIVRIRYNEAIEVVNE